MKLLKDRRPGAFFGASLMLLLPVISGVWAVTVNPWFMDEPLIFAGLILLPCAVLGALVGALIARACFSRSLLGLNLLGIAWIFFRPVPQGVDDVQLLVFGMDGASWQLIDKMEMPSIEALQETGSRGVLESEDPMLSPLLWTTMATGQRPDAHGIRGFNTSADKIAAARVWDIAAMEGMSVGLYKWLVTYPAIAGEAGGFVVPAWLAADVETDPPELSVIKQLEFSNRLKRKNKAEKIPTWQIPLLTIPQGLRFSTLRRAGALWAAERVHRPGPMEKARNLQLLRVWMDRDFFLAQLHRNPTNIATFTTYATDALGHTHWEWMTRCHDMSTMSFIEDDEDCPEWAQALPEAYRQADEVLGEILDEVGWDTHIVVLSDHGFRSSSEDDAGRYFVPLTSHLQEQLENRIGKVQVQRLGKKLIVSLQDAHVENQRAALNDYLENLKQTSTDEPLFIWENIPHSTSTVGLTFRVEDMNTERLGWDYVEDTICWNATGMETCTAALSEYAEPDEQNSGEHDVEGIILASGPYVEQGPLAQSARLIDVAPSLLTLIGLPASDDMVGDSLWGNELMRVPGVEYMHLAPLSFMDYTETDNAMQSELEALGYIE